MLNRTIVQNVPPALQNHAKLLRPCTTWKKQLVMGKYATGTTAPVLKLAKRCDFGVCA